MQPRLQSQRDNGIMMSMNKKTLAIALAACAAGVLLGHFAWTSGESAAEPEEHAVRHKGRVVDAEQSANIAALRRRVRELERQLAGAAASARAPTNASSAAEVQLADASAQQRPGPHSPEDWRARMEDMKTNDPERYAQMTNRMAQWRSRSIANTQDKLDFFASLDTSRMTPRQRENHERLQELLVRREELMRTMDFTNESVTEAQREKARHEMHELMGQLHTAERTERDMLLRQAARNLGCNNATAKELVDTVKTIYDATQSWGGGRRHGGGGPPPPPPHR